MPYELSLPVEEDEAVHVDNVVPLRTSDVMPAEPPGEVAIPSEAPGLLDRFEPVREQLAATWSAAWVGAGVFGLRPRPVVDLVHQFWTDPKPYIRDALILRIPYAVYGAPVIVVTAAAHLLLLVISYPALLTAAIAVTLFVILLT